MIVSRIETQHLPAGATCAGACCGANPVYARFYFAGNGWMLFLCRACGGRYL